MKANPQAHFVMDEGWSSFCLLFTWAGIVKPAAECMFSTSDVWVISDSVL